ncbi:hypothetical protein D7318_04215 [Streptomyces radicis]|uniref:Uncharacterized protein n=2 Tax=Streptomyces radicis TaxID=1750517 RepID=A0ABX9RP97_9ACTN|nr:hypothetical protein D7318_04215 [Streptomyces radicis]
MIVFAAEPSPVDRALLHRDRLRDHLAARALPAHRVQVMETTEGRVSVTLDLPVEVAAFVADRLAALVYEPDPGTLLYSPAADVVGAVARRESAHAVRLRAVAGPDREWSHWLTDLRPARLGEVCSVMERPTGKLTGKVHRLTS